jgi:nicotinamide riboside kinase
VRIIIEFYPQKTTNYYERVFCVVRNHQILYVDLIGTCYDVLNKPMPLMQRHIDIYRHKVIMGIHNRVRRDKDGSRIGESTSNEHQSHDFSSMDLEIN